MSSTLRIAIVGCGQIADAHLQEIPKTGLANVVAVCDSELDIARQAAARFGIADIYNDVDEMIASSAPDVVHITTPPPTHHALAMHAIHAGCHVYIRSHLL